MSSTMYFLLQVLELGPVVLVAAGPGQISALPLVGGEDNQELRNIAHNVALEEHHTPIYDLHTAVARLEGGPGLDLSGRQSAHGEENVTRIVLVFLLTH